MDKRRSQIFDGMIMALILVMSMAFFTVSGGSVKAAENKVKNSGIQVYYYASSNAIGVNFSSIRDVKKGDEINDFVNWDGLDGNAGSYEIQVAKNKKMTKDVKKKIVDKKLNADCRYNKKQTLKVSAGKIYYVRARGIFSEKSGKVYGPWSKIVKVDSGRKDVKNVKKLKTKAAKNKKVKITWSKVKKPKWAKKVFYYVELISAGKFESDTTAKAKITLQGNKGNNYVTVIPYINSNNKSDFKNFENGVCYVGKEEIKTVG